MKYQLNKLRIALAGLFCLMLALTISSCDDDFDELNTNPGATTTLDSKFLLNFATNRAGSSRYELWRGDLIYASQWAQQLAGNWSPDNYNTSNEDWLSAYWNTVYGDYMRNFQAIIDQEEGTNIEAMAMIMKVLLMQRVTDLYGDIPYSEAFQGGNLPQPKYDTQEEVYMSFLAELRQAIGQLSPGNGENPGNFDPLYNGDIAKWEKFGNSVLLRVGLRMSEVNSSLSQTVVAEAIAGGVISSDDEIAYLRFDGSMPDGPVASGIGEVFNDFGVGGGGFAFSDEFIDRLQAAEDPRLPVLAVKYNSDGSVDDSVVPGQYEGKVNGRDVSTIFDFAMPNHSTIVAYGSPIFFMTLAEVEFNRAEAIVRGWVSGDAEAAYESGVRAANRQLALYPGTMPITDDQIDNLLDQPTVAYNDANALELINTQKWIALLFDGFEAYANYRRIGFPDLTPGETAGESDGEIPKRLRYPQGEELANRENYEAAVARLSNGDKITSRLWWDVN